jgi:hypothetical protein
MLTTKNDSKLIRLGTAGLTAYYRLPDQLESYSRSGNAPGGLTAYRACLSAYIKLLKMLI